MPSMPIEVFPGMLRASIDTVRIFFLWIRLMQHVVGMEFHNDVL